MSVISDLALKIFQTEFDGDTGIMYQSYIEAWLNSNLGQLNTRLNESFSGSDASLNLEAQAIYKEMYMGSYYRRQSRSALRGLVGNTNGADILSLKDGSSSVSFTNKNEVAKVYKSMADDCEKRIVELSHKYNIYQSEPLQLGGIETTLMSTLGMYNKVG